MGLPSSRPGLLLDLHPWLSHSHDEMSGLVGYGSSDDEDEGGQNLPAPVKVISLCTLLERHTLDEIRGLLMV